MIITEELEQTINGKKLYKTYSDLGLTILQNETGNIYESAIDIEGKNFTYSEIIPQKKISLKKISRKKNLSLEEQKEEMERRKYMDMVYGIKEEVG